MDYREKRKQDCLQLFEGFALDVSKSNNPEKINAVFDLAKQGFFSREIAAQLNCSPKSVQKIFRRYNFPVLQNFCPPLREERLGWKGGIKKAKGYLYSRTPGHPYGSKHGCYVAVHRLVMEQQLGRYLLPTEVVDHIDGDITNNEPSNLRVFESNAEHLRVTLAGKVPNWSEKGKESLQQARTQPRRTWKGRAIEPNRET